MFCPKCGESNPDLNNFCAKCGNNLREVNTQTYQSYVNPIAQQAKAYNNSNPYYGAVKKSKKKTGCLVAILVAVALFIIIAIASNGAADKQYSTFTTEDPAIITQSTTAEDSSITTQTTKNAVKTTSYEEYRKTKLKSSIRIYKDGTYVSEPNSAGGVDLYIHWVNKSEKVIKYISFSVVPINAVDDIVTDEMTNRSTFSGKCTGPYYQGQGVNGNKYWECAWYNNTIERIKFIEVNIEYMDGSTFSIGEDEIKYIMK